MKVDVFELQGTHRSSGVALLVGPASHLPHFVLIVWDVGCKSVSFPLPQRVLLTRMATLHFAFQNIQFIPQTLHGLLKLFNHFFRTRVWSPLLLITPFQINFFHNAFALWIPAFGWLRRSRHRAARFSLILERQILDRREEHLVVESKLRRAVRLGA